MLKRRIVSLLLVLGIAAGVIGWLVGAFPVFWPGHDSRLAGELKSPAGSGSRLEPGRPGGEDRDAGDKQVTKREDAANMPMPEMPDFCNETEFGGARVIACVVDPSTYDVALVYKGADGAVYGSVRTAVARLADDDETPLLAMNAGMYHSHMSPVGLYVENGVEIAPLNTGSAFGNFFLKPNGVFFIDQDGHAGVRETEAYAQSSVKPVFATQSGPMLVIDGAIHPRFLPDGTSKHIRNGVGVRDDGKVVLAITRDPINLWGFASFFKDFAKCPNALFFDGTVSSLAFGADMVIDSGDPAGPIVAVFAKSRALPQG